MRKRAGFTWLELIILVGIVITISYLAVPNFGEPYPYTHSRVSRTKADMRSLATAIEAYFADNKQYPAMTPLADWATGSEVATLKEMGGDTLFTIAASPYPHKTSAGLTTPNAYASSLFNDPLFPSKRRGMPFAYSTNNESWILLSGGPDEDFDVVNPLTMLHGNFEETKTGLLPYTYDPTNGSVSDGDVWRIKQ